MRESSRHHREARHSDETEGGRNEEDSRKSDCLTKIPPTDPPKAELSAGAVRNTAVAVAMAVGSKL